MKTTYLFFGVFLLLASSIMASSTLFANSNDKVILIEKSISTFDHTGPITPYEMPRFQEWAARQTNNEILRYLNDENYRELINNWNEINNPFWADAITARCLFGTFDFTGGLSKTNEILVYDNLQEHRRYSYNLNPSKQSNNLGQPYFNNGKVQGQNRENTPINIAQLPTRDPKLTTVHNNTVAKPNFTKNIPVSIKRVKKGWNSSKESNTYFNNSMSSNQAYYEQGIGGSTMSGSNSNSSRYSNYSNSKGGNSAAPVTNTNSSQSSKSGSTGRTTTITTSKS